MKIDKSTNLKDFNHLQVYSCKVYVHILKKQCQQSIKFNNQSKFKKLIKYKDSNIYKI